MDTNKTRNLISLGLVIGTIAGAAGAFFLAPKKGTETKKQLARKMNHLTQKSILKTQEALIKFEGAVESSMDNDDSNIYY